MKEEVGAGVPDPLAFYKPTTIHGTPLRSVVPVLMAVLFR